ncbi:hypothetical protein HYC85_018578 [Camellia sinensis]|uniref:Pentatricopeptide repeat-containing protein n=1 Tax=Camellia sinensis TaxID=4442 RepID=A0A7J7GX22_CAMSI|nr:hypothetical protein HYC85_018578 [Camellia sinensis]
MADYPQSDRQFSHQPTSPNHWFHSITLSLHQRPTTFCTHQLPLLSPLFCNTSSTQTPLPMAKRSTPTFSKLGSRPTPISPLNSSFHILNLVVLPMHAKRLVFSNEKSDGFAFSMMLKASTCESVSSVTSSLGKQVHAQVVKSDVEGDEVLYIALVNAPTISTFASIIGACSVLSVFEIGQQVQAQIMKTELFTDIKMGSALIDMYAKCGRIEDARRVFDHMHERNVFSWTSMINGYGKNGNPEEALVLFFRLQRDRYIEPNYVTFLSALSACGHAGLVAKGQEIFDSMERDYSMKPKIEHYACMVDLLGRAGSLNQAWEFVMAMPEKPNSDVWAALLSACRLHDDVEMASIVSNEIFKLSHDGRPGAYIALSNTLAAAGKWGSVSELRELMKVIVDMHMPMLLVRDNNSGGSAGVDQGSLSRHEMVHRTDPLLVSKSSKKDDLTFDSSDLSFDSRTCHKTDCKREDSRCSVVWLTKYEGGRAT